MKSDPYRADRFYLIIITVHVKTFKNNTTYYFATNSRENFILNFRKKILIEIKLRYVLR